VPDLGAARDLATTFRTTLLEHQIAQLAPWLECAATGRLPEFQALAVGISRDRAAVELAISSEQSSGQIEGQVNRLKLIKRTMYGRGKLGLFLGESLPVLRPLPRVGEGPNQNITTIDHQWRLHGSVVGKLTTILTVIEVLPFPPNVGESRQHSIRRFLLPDRHLRRSTERLHHLQQPLVATANKQKQPVIT
jgi:hypothetical protein